MTTRHSSASSVLFSTATTETMPPFTMFQSAAEDSSPTQDEDDRCDEIEVDVQEDDKDCEEVVFSGDYCFDDNDEIYAEEYDEDYNEDIDIDNVIDNNDESEKDSYGNNSITEPRLDAFDSYIVVSVLTATASFAAIIDDSSSDNNGSTETTITETTTHLARNLAILISATCSLSGIYATVVFSFSSIYGRTAVALGRFEAYQTFLQQTASLRKKAFYAYLMSLVLFIVLLIVTATDKMEDRFKVPFLMFLVGLSGLVYRDWSQIVVAAGAIFAEEETNSSSSNKNVQQRNHGMKLRSSDKAKQS